MIETILVVSAMALALFIICEFVCEGSYPDKEDLLRATTSFFEITGYSVALLAVFLHKTFLICEDEALLVPLVVAAIYMLALRIGEFVRK